jgi:hypothetical protein
MDALAPQVIGHAIVDVNKRIHFRLAERTKTRRKIGVPHKICPRRDQLKGAKEPAKDSCRRVKGYDKKYLNAYEPDPLVPQKIRDDGSENEMNSEKVEDELAPKGHGESPNFSNRR